MHVATYVCANVHVSPYCVGVCICMCMCVCLVRGCVCVCVCACVRACVQKDGGFIVRDPSRVEDKGLGFYSLSVWHGGETLHFRYVKTSLNLVMFISCVFV